MPAAELQLSLALAQRLNGRDGKVAVLSPACEKTTASFSTTIPNNLTVSYNTDLASLATLSNLDGLIVNHVLTQENVVENGRLDTFIANALNALKTGGVCVIRADLSSYKDGKKVAKLTDYFDVFRTESHGKNLGFHLYAVSPVEASIYAHGNWADFFWTLIKEEFPISKDSNVTFRDFLDKTQYTDTGIYAYEWIFGQDFISPGGWPENLRVLNRFETLAPGQTMLDIGVGIGGGARQAASVADYFKYIYKEFGIHVTGIDLSANMLAVALDRNHRDKDARVKYMITDALVYDFPEDHFDYVFSRDCIQHIKDTQGLLNRIFKWLKPGGKVLITMYGVGHGTLSEKFKEYVTQRAYFLRNREQFKEFAEKAGFENVVLENWTPRFKEILHEERDRVENNKEEFLRKFSQKEYDSLVVGWNNKLEYIRDDNQNWNCFIATKPGRKEYTEHMLS